MVPDIACATGDDVDGAFSRVLATGDSVAPLLAALDAALIEQCINSIKDTVPLTFIPDTQLQSELLAGYPGMTRRPDGG